MSGLEAGVAGGSGGLLPLAAVVVAAAGAAAAPLQKAHALHLQNLLRG